MDGRALAFGGLAVVVLAGLALEPRGSRVDRTTVLAHPLVVLRVRPTPRFSEWRVDARVPKTREVPFHSQGFEHELDAVRWAESWARLALRFGYAEVVRIRKGDRTWTVDPRRSASRVAV